MRKDWGGGRMASASTFARTAHVQRLGGREEQSLLGVVVFTPSLACTRGRGDYLRQPCSQPRGRGGGTQAPTLTHRFPFPGSTVGLPQLWESDGVTSKGWPKMATQFSPYDHGPLCKDQSHKYNQCDCPAGEPSNSHGLSGHGLVTEHPHCHGPLCRDSGHDSVTQIQRIWWPSVANPHTAIVSVGLPRDSGHLQGPRHSQSLPPGYCYCYWDPADSPCRPGA